MTDSLCFRTLESKCMYSYNNSKWYWCQEKWETKLAVTCLKVRRMVQLYYDFVQIIGGMSIWVYI